MVLGIDETVESAKKLVGTVLKDKWTLDRLLGVGGMAAVYAATHRNGKRVAVKMLHRTLASNDEIRSRFLREGYVANKVEHPGAVSVLDDEVADDGAVFLVMDLLEGETVDARWERKGHALPPTEVLAIAEQLLDVLGAAHDKGIIHRDIKPENVFLTRAGAIKVLDFGIARLRQTSGPKETQVGTMMGTPAFMPPEQARGRMDEIDARTDVWAVGAMMFTLLTGRYVHEAATANEVLLHAMTKPAAPVQSLAATLDPRIAQVIDRALAFDRRDRWPDARAMQAAVRDACDAAGALWQPQLPAPSNHDIVVPPVVSRSKISAVTTGRPITQTASEPRSSGRALGTAIGGLVATVALVAIGATLMMRAPKQKGEAAGAPLVAAAPTVTAPVERLAEPASTSTPTSTPTAPTPTQTPTSASTPTTPTSTSTPITTTTPTPTQSQPHRSAKPAAPAKVSCNPPFEFDANGVKRWKPGCL